MHTIPPEVLSQKEKWRQVCFRPPSWRGAAGAGSHVARTSPWWNQQGHWGGGAAFHQLLQPQGFPWQSRSCCCCEKQSTCAAGPAGQGQEWAASLQAAPEALWLGNASALHPSFIRLSFTSQLHSSVLFYILKGSYKDLLSPEGSFKGCKVCLLFPLPVHL